TGRRIGEASREADAGPAADARKHRDILLAVMLIGVDVADDARRGLVLPQLFAGLGVDGLEVAFERAVEHDVAGGRESARPSRELLLVRPHDLAGLGVPRDEIAHVGLA